MFRSIRGVPSLAGIYRAVAVLRKAELLDGADALQAAMVTTNDRSLPDSPASFRADCPRFTPGNDAGGSVEWWRKTAAEVRKVVRRATEKQVLRISRTSGRRASSRTTGRRS